MLYKTLTAVTLAATASYACANELTLSIDTWGDYISKSSPNNGALTEIVQLSFAQSEVNTRLSWVPWKRIEEVEIDNNNAISYGWIKNPARESRWLYSAPFYSSGDIFITHVDTPFEWKTLEDLKPYKIGVTRGYSYGSAFDAAKSWLHIDYANSDKSNLKKVLARRLDLFISDPKVASAEISKHSSLPKEQFKFIMTPRVSSWSVHLVCAKSNKDCAKTISTFNSGLEQLTASGKHKELVDQFLELN